MDWIQDYVDYTSSQESPRLFHKWCAISAIASALSRRVFLRRTSKHGVEFFKTWPGQICVILVAGAGRCKKSTAISIALNIMKETGGIELYEGKITPEQLLAKMSGLAIPRLTIVAEELSAFLTKTSYNDGLIDNLNKLIDGSNTPYETKKKQYKLNNPALTMNCATTPTNLAKAILPQALGHGYSSRQIYVYSEDPGSPEPLAYFDPPDAKLADDYERKRVSLIVRLQRFTELDGEFRWSQDGSNWYQNWYHEYKQTGQSNNEGWPQRIPDHIIRVAMVLSVSRGSSNLLLEAKDLADARKLIFDVDYNMPKAFAYIGQHVNAEQLERIQRIFKERASLLGIAHACIPAQELFSRTSRFVRDSNELRALMQTLIDSGNAGSLPMPNGGRNFIWLKDLET